MPPDSITKCCSICREIKPLTAFHKHSHSPDGHQYRCKTCNVAACREYRQSRLATDNAYQRTRYAKTIDKKRADAREYYYARRKDPKKLEQMRIQKLDAYKRRQAKAGKPDAETLAYIGVLRSDPCSYCGAYPAGTIDHIIPLDNGGAHHWLNLTAACETCNKSKQLKDAAHYLLHRLKMRR